MNNNIWSILIATLNDIPVSGEQNFRKMLSVIDVLRRVERTANEGEETNAESE